MFVKANLLSRLRYKFESEPLAEKLKEVFGASTEFGSDAIKTLLLWSCATPRRARLGHSAITLTESTTIRSDMTTILNFPLWQLVRASTAAPAYSLPK